MFRKRLILVDDHRVLSDAIAKLVEPEFDVVGIFEDGRTFLAEVETLQPDVVVLEIGLRRIDGLTVAAKLKKKMPRTKLVFLTMHQKKEIAAQAFRVGASAYVLKSARGMELLKALRTVALGGYYASPELTEGMVGSFVQAFKRMREPQHLTERQKEVLQLIREGHVMREIARDLKISKSTVAFHKYTMMEQLNIKTSAELINYAIDNLPDTETRAMNFAAVIS